MNIKHIELVCEDAVMQKLGHLESRNIKQRFQKGKWLQCVSGMGRTGSGKEALVLLRGVFSHRSVTVRASGPQDLFAPAPGDRGS